MSFNLNDVLTEVYDRCPQWADLSGVVKFREGPEYFLVGNDGRTIYYNSRKLQHYTRESQIFFIAQQFLHIQLAHTKRGEDLDIRSWSKASDAVVNAMLVRDGFEQPANVVIPPDALRMSAEQLYEIFLKQAEEDDEDDHFDPDSDKRDDTP